MAKFITITLIGIGMVIGAFLIYQSTSSFLVGATTAEGTVVKLIQSGTGKSARYKPVVHYIDQTGQTIEFVSQNGSNPPSYSRGQRVEIVYHPMEPQNARINDFFSLWGGTLAMGGMGVGLVLVGTGIMLWDTLKRRKDSYLKKSGTPIETEYQRVELNTALMVNGRHPFVVLTQWKNLSTSELHTFRSHNLWFDPSSYLKDKRITVFIEKDNPKKYYVDLSFLPKPPK